MTTTVILQYPTPNHLCARVFRQQKDRDGNWQTVDFITVGPETQIVVQTVYTQQRLVIEERAANYLPTVRDGDKPSADGRDEYAEWIKSQGPVWAKQKIGA